MPRKSRGLSSGQCLVCCQRMSSGVNPSARWVTEAEWRTLNLGIFTLVAPHTTFLFNMAITLTCFFPQGSHFTKHSSASDNSQLTFLGCLSSSSYDVYVEEAGEVVLATSGQEVVSDRYYLDNEAVALQNEDFRVLLELSSSEFGIYLYKTIYHWRLHYLLCSSPSCFFADSCQDASMKSESDESLMSEDVLCTSEYAEDIYRHLRESEVRNFQNYDH